MDTTMTNHRPDDHTEKLRINAKRCADTIKFMHNGIQHKPFHSARAPPNQRLCEVFGINNAFTTTDGDIHREFKTDALRKMKAATHITRNDSREDWRDLCEQAKNFLKEFIDRSDKHCDLAGLIQYITLKTSLCYLFADAKVAMALGDPFDKVTLISQSINQLWIESKLEEGARPQWSGEERLHEALKRVTVLPVGGFPSSSGDPPSDPLNPDLNPMNFLLPAYETMWRIVLRCFIEIRYRNAMDGPSWSTVLEEYVEAIVDPDRMHEKPFHKVSSDGTRPIDIIKEGLRLYPPTRRVHRDFDGVLVKADIEACHRSQLLGQHDPLVFRPERWQQICPGERDKEYPKNNTSGNNNTKKVLKEAEEKLGFMPFAIWCAADSTESKGFGMKMIALLVGVLCHGIDKTWNLKNSGKILPEMGEPLDAERAAYEVLLLDKIGGGTGP